MARRAGLYTDAEIAFNQRTWLAELESGKLKQVNGELVGKRKGTQRASYAYCCLGVGMKCLGYKRCNPDSSSTFDFGFKCGDIVETTALSREAADKLGLADTTGTFSCSSLRRKNPALVKIIEEKYGHVMSKGSTDSLAGLNDADVPFKVIAQVIRTEPTGLFKKGKAFIGRNWKEVAAQVA